VNNNAEVNKRENKRDGRKSRRPKPKKWKKADSHAAAIVDKTAAKRRKVKKKKFGKNCESEDIFEGRNSSGEEVKRKTGRDLANHAGAAWNPAPWGQNQQGAGCPSLDKKN